MIRELADGVAKRGAFEACEGVISGYVGTGEIGEAVLATVAKVKSANPAARYCCDPVIGDVGRGVYVAPGVPEFLRDHAVPAADVVTPNQFELDHLRGRRSATLRDAVAAVDAVHPLGPHLVLGTSLRTAQT